MITHSLVKKSASRLRNNMLKPIRDNLILEIIEQETVTAGGIHLPGAALEKPYFGRVVECNDQYVMPDGSMHKSEIAKGDLVYFGKTHGTEIKHDGVKYLVISEEFILCKE